MDFHFYYIFRDFLSDIRSVCIHELGQWMQVYPQHFLEDSYLKYIGWSLYDKVNFLFFQTASKIGVLEIFLVEFDLISFKFLLFLLLLGK